MCSGDSCRFQGLNLEDEPQNKFFIPFKKGNCIDNRTGVMMATCGKNCRHNRNNRGATS